MNPENLSKLLAYSRIRRRPLRRYPPSAAAAAPLGEDAPSRHKTPLLKDLLDALLGPQVSLLNYGLMAGAAIPVGMGFSPERAPPPDASYAFVFATTLACLRLAIG